MKHSNSFSQTDISRLLKAVEKAGKHVEQIEIDVNGRIIAVFNPTKNRSSNNPWDSVLK